MYTFAVFEMPGGVMLKGRWTFRVMLKGGNTTANMTVKVYYTSTINMFYSSISA